MGYLDELAVSPCGAWMTWDTFCAKAHTMFTSFCPGIAAATIFSPSRDVVVSQSQLRVAFDGDAVLFSDESERIVKAHGLDRFFEHEKAHENKPLAQVLHIPRTPE